jgi:hypothetical protein
MTYDELRIDNRNSLCGIIVTARYFADPDFQRRIWINGEGPEVSSYYESLCSLFDDSHVMSSDNGDALALGCSEEMCSKLGGFVATLDNFDEGLQRPMRDSEIFALPAWQAVISSASTFVDSSIAWLEQNCGDFLMFKWSWKGRSFGGKEWRSDGDS